jgi:hypothetical protein
MNLKKEIESVLNSLKNKGYTRGEIEEELDYADNYIDQVLAKGGNERFLNALKKLDERLLQKAMSPKERLQATRNHLKAKSKTIPLYDAPAIGGDTESDMTPITAPTGTIDVGDLLKDSQAAIRIYGNSMIPNYPPGCVVGLIKNEDSFITPGEVYVVETKTKRVLKRLFYKNDDPDSDTFACYSDNTLTFDGGARYGMPAYPIFYVKRDEVKLFIVTGVIKRNENSMIVNKQS